MLEQCPAGRRTAIRFMVYSAAGFGMMAALLAFGPRLAPANLFREGGAVEWAQVGTVALASALLFVQGWRHPSLRAMFMVLAVLAAAAVARELDDALEGVVPGGWKVPAAACAGVALVLWWRDPDRWWAQVTRWVNTPSFALWWAGFMVAVVFAQLFDGQAEFWQAASGGQQSGAFRGAVEELLELGGYLLVLLGTVESFFAAPAIAADPVGPERS